MATLYCLTWRMKDKQLAECPMAFQDHNNSLSEELICRTTKDLFGKTKKFHAFQASPKEDWRDIVLSPKKVRSTYSHNLSMQSTNLTKPVSVVRWRERCRRPLFQRTSSYLLICHHLSIQPQTSHNLCH